MQDLPRRTTQTRRTATVRDRRGTDRATRPVPMTFPQVGGLAEWPMATVLKTVSAVTPCSGVRIPRPPREQLVSGLTCDDPVRLIN
jgi:hypothetical protein